MTRWIGNTLIIERENPQQCDECGEIRELRQLGPNNATLCFTCASKHPDWMEDYGRKLFC